MHALTLCFQICLLPLQAFQDVVQLGAANNNVVIASFLQACWIAPMTVQQEARVLGDVATQRQSTRFNSFVYTALLTFCTRHAMPERALEVWAARHEVRGPPGRRMAGVSWQGHEDLEDT